MPSAKMVKGLNQQIRMELFSSYSYLAIAGYFESENLSGFANFFRIQAQEELVHAMKLFDYLLKVDCEPVLEALGAPQQKYSSPVDAFKLGLSHEKKVSSEINKLMDQAMAESDHGTRVLLNWFVEEQLEEESLFQRSVKRLQLVAGDPRGLFELDREFGARSGADAKAGADGA